MYFWKTKSLESELSDGSLSQRERYKYLLAFMIITAICMELSSYISELPSFTRFIESSLILLATIIGTIYCYNVNQQGDNADFIDRYICLSLPIFIQVVVFFVIIFSTYMILGFVLLGDSFDRFTDSTNWIDVIFAIGFELFFYWKLSVSIQKIAMSNINSEQGSSADPRASRPSVS